LPYKQGVIGSNPIAPTKNQAAVLQLFIFKQVIGYIINSYKGFAYIGQTNTLPDRLCRENFNGNQVL